MPHPPRRREPPRGARRGRPWHPDPGVLSGLDPAALASDRGMWGRLVETAIGAHLVNTAGTGVEMTWWRERNREVDFVVADGRRVTAIEVASGRRKDALSGLGALTGAVAGARPLLIGAQGLPLEGAFEITASDLLAD